MENINAFREVTPLSSEDCFFIIDRIKSKMTYPVHYHPEYELNFIENGKGIIRIVGDSLEEIDDLELCLIGNEQLEHGWVEPDNREPELMHEITIQFHPDLFLESLLNKLQFQSIAVLLENAKKGVVFSRESIYSIKNRLKLLSEHESNFEAVIELFSILNLLSHDNNYRILCNSSFVKNDDVSESRRVQKAINYIKMHYTEKLSLNDVANQVNMTTSSFSRFMKSRTGKNFIEYLNDLRLGSAARSLVNTNKTISEICYECGYNNLSNFNRLFKQRKGYTPKEFREKYKKMRKLI
jgi:YesN/AraC family two-component response regulator